MDLRKAILIKHHQDRIKLEYKKNNSLELLSMHEQFYILLIMLVILVSLVII